MDEVEHCGHSLFPELQQWHNFNLNKGREKVGKIAPFSYGLENGRRGKLSPESDGLENAAVGKKT